MSRTLTIVSLSALAVVGVAFGVFKIWTAHRADLEAAAQTQATAAATSGTQGAAQDALKITVQSQAVHGQIDIQTHEATNAILNAPGANQAVDTAVHSTGLRSLCLFAAYRGSDACRELLKPDPVNPQG